MTETERLKAAGVSAVDAAYAAWQATVNSANTARAAYNAICKTYNAALAAQEKETPNE